MEEPECETEEVTLDNEQTITKPKSLVEQGTDNAEAISVESMYVVLNDTATSATVQSLLKQFDLLSHRLVFVCADSVTDADKTWDLLLKSASKAKSCGLNIAYVFYGTADWPCTKQNLTQECPPCINLKCQKEALAHLKGDLDLNAEIRAGCFHRTLKSSNSQHQTNRDAENAETSSGEFQNALERYLCNRLNPAYLLTIITKNSLKWFLSVASSSQRLPMAIVLETHPQSYEDDDAKFFRRIARGKYFAHSLFLHQSWFSSFSYSDSVILTLLASLSPYTLCMKFLQKIGDANTRQKLYQKQLDESPILSHVGTLSSGPLTFLDPKDTIRKVECSKSYTVIKYSPDSVSIPPMVANELPKFSQILQFTTNRSQDNRTLDFDEQICESFEWLRRQGDEELRHPLYVIFDPMALLINNKAQAKPINESRKGKCIVIGWFALLAIYLEHSNWDATKNICGEIPVIDQNTCVNSYIFLDGDVLDECKKDFKREVYDSLTKAFLKHKVVQFPELTTDDAQTMTNSAANIASSGQSQGKSSVSNDSDSNVVKVSIKEKPLGQTNNNGDGKGVSEAKIFTCNMTITRQENFLCCFSPYSSQSLPLVNGVLHLVSTKSDQTELDCDANQFESSFENMQSDDCLLLSKLALSVCIVYRYSDSDMRVKSLLAKVLVDLRHTNPDITNKTYKRILKEIMENNEDDEKGFLHSEVNDRLSKISKCLSDVGLIYLDHDALLDVFLLYLHRGNVTAIEAFMPHIPATKFIAFTLYAVGVYKHSLKVRSDLSGPVREDLQKSAETLESKAKSVIHEIYRHDSAVSEKVLFATSNFLDYYTPFDLACIDEARDFLSDEACTSAINTSWWQCLSPTPWYQNLLLLVLPCMIYNSNINVKHKSENVDDDRCSWRCVYRSPAIRCRVHYVVFMGFLFFYSYVLLTGLSDGIDIHEYIILVWMGSLFTEEVRQLIHSSFEKNGNFVKYFKDFWNILDVIGLVLFSIAAILSIISSVLGISLILVFAHAVFAVHVILLYVRSLQFFVMHKTIGPLLIMIKGMFKGLANFVLILLVVLMGYAIALHAVLHPETEVNFGMINEMFHIPYFQIYGEIGVEYEIEAVLNKTYESDPSELEQDVYLAGFYLLVTNILLLNLLIAMFNTTYVKIEEKTGFYDVIHKISILQEYQECFNLPPPFVVISYVIWGFTKCWSLHKKPGKPRTDDEYSYTDGDIMIIEKAIKSIYAQQNEFNNENVHSQIKEIKQLIRDEIKHWLAKYPSRMK